MGAADIILRYSKGNCVLPYQPNQVGKAFAIDTDFHTMKVAIAQITSIPNPERNLRLCRKIVAKAAANGAELVAFPESSDVIFGPGCESADERKELKRTKAFRDGMGQAAKESSVWVVFGCHMPVSRQASRLQPGRGMSLTLLLPW